MSLKKFQTHTKSKTFLNGQLILLQTRRSALSEFIFRPSLASRGQIEIVQTKCLRYRQAASDYTILTPGFSLFSLS